MKRIAGQLGLLLLATALLVAQYAGAAGEIAAGPVSPSGEEAAGDQWLFLIAIDAYTHWPQLKTAVNDAKSVRDVLLSRYFFDKDHLIELYNEQATRENILNRLNFLEENLAQDDSLLIFYAGHGHLDPTTKTGSWIPVEGGIGDQSTWIPNKYIKSYLQVDAIKARHILLISNSYFSGDFFTSHRGKRTKPTYEVAKSAYKLTSRLAITSGGLEPATGAGFGDSSVFSHFLVEALEQNQKPFLIPSDFFPDIKQEVVENAEQCPQFGSLKDTGGRPGGEIVLFLRDDSRPKDLSAKAAHREETLKRLKQMEAAAEEAARRDAAEIAGHEGELAELDDEIAAMQKRLETGSALSGDTVNAMLAMVELKEGQEKHIEDLKRQKKAEEAERRAKIERLKAEEEAVGNAAIREAVHNYEKVVSLRLGEDMKALAWKALIEEHPAAKGLAIGDIAGFKSMTGISEIIGRDGRFIAYEDGTVRDTETGLMWAARDNGEDITWREANGYCVKYRGGGYTDWRLPAVDELASLYDETKKNSYGYHVTKLIGISACCPWASSTLDALAGNFHFGIGARNLSHQFLSTYARVLPVRGGR